MDCKKSREIGIGKRHKTQQAGSLRVLRAGRPSHRQVAEPLRGRYPEIIIQTSPGLTTGIVILHAVEHHCAVQYCLVAEFDILVLRREFEQPLAHQPQFSFGQLGQFVDDFRRTHALRSQRSLISFARAPRTALMMRSGRGLSGANRTVPTAVSYPSSVSPSVPRAVLLQTNSPE